MQDDERFSDRRVLVTGGAGFIGSHTVDALLERGSDVLVVDDLSTGHRENVNAEAEFVEMNIADPELRQVVDEFSPHYVYHFAFFVLVPQSVEDPLLDLDVIRGSLQLLQQLRDRSLEKFVFASSGFVYGNNPNLPLDESAPIQPVTPYVVSKRAVEHYLEFYRRASGLPYVVYRYPSVYGPRQVTGAMADYIRKLSAGEQAEMWGDGTKTRDYLFVEDVVRANLWAPRVPDDREDPVYNLGTGRETTLNEIYGMIADLVAEEADPIYHPDRPGEQHRYALDASKIRDELGWEPRVSLLEGLRRTVTYWKERGFDL